MKSNLKILACIPVAGAILAGSAMANQVNWRVEQSAATFSNGNIIQNGEFTFALGTFGAGFDASDPFTFADSWIDTGLVTSSIGWTNLGNAGFPAFGQSGGSNNIVGTLVRPEGPVGDQAYIFGYTSLDVGTAPEWIVLTNPSWIFPTGTAVGSPPSISGDWRSAAGGTVMVYGSGFNHTSAGAPLDRSFETQAIPEPSTYALIFGLGILGFLGYRRTRK